MNQKRIDELIESGDIEQCSACDELSAYSWDLAEDSPESGEVAHIPACSGLGDWQCGHCGCTNVPRDSPALAEVYTHIHIKHILGDDDD